MAAKYVVTGIITSLLAGGAVFMVADAAELHPHDRVVKRTDKAASSNPAASTTDEAGGDTSKMTIQRMLSTSDDRSDDAQVDADDTDERDAIDSKPAPRPAADREEADTNERKAWLDRYLAKNSDNDPEDEGDNAQRLMDAQPREADTSMRTTREPVGRWLDGSKGEARMDGTIKADRERTMGTFVITPGERDADDDADQDAPAVTASEGDPRNGVASMDGGTAMSTRHSGARMSRNGPYALLLAEAEKLEITDVRDGAYLNIVDFALMRGDYDRARDVLGNLSTEELRDTARQNMGIALARAGRMEEAFAVVDALEVDELSDPIRLAIIQAATENRRLRFDRTAMER